SLSYAQCYDANIIAHDEVVFQEFEHLESQMDYWRSVVGICMKFLPFLLVSKNREDLLQLDKDIEHLYRDLILSLNTINVVYRPVELPYPDHA
ncbi:hypothetical protein KI387_034328, partial [Taxus chinensis]